MTDTAVLQAWSTHDNPLPNTFLLISSMLVTGAREAAHATEIPYEHKRRASKSLWRYDITLLQSSVEKLASCMYIVAKDGVHGRSGSAFGASVDFCLCRLAWLRSWI